MYCQKIVDIKLEVVFFIELIQVFSKSTCYFEADFFNIISNILSDIPLPKKIEKKVSKIFVQHSMFFYQEKILFEAQ